MSLFKIEFSEQRFRVVAPDGEYEDAVGFCQVSTVLYQGKVYGAYLTGSEAELDELSNHPTMTTMRPRNIKVYDLSTWPNLSNVFDVELEEIEFDEDEQDEEGEEEGEILDVEPAE